jgi:hypothetical protein
MWRWMHIVQLLVIPYDRVDVSHSSRRGFSAARGAFSGRFQEHEQSCLYSSAISIIPEPLIKYSSETKRLTQP